MQFACQKGWWAMIPVERDDRLVTEIREGTRETYRRCQCQQETDAWKATKKKKKYSPSVEGTEKNKGKRNDGEKGEQGRD